VKRPKEILGLILLLVLGLVPRLVFVTRFPTIPVSDFHSLVAFGLDLRDHGLTYHSRHWEYLNPGLPLILSGLFRLAPSAAPEVVARLAILPFVVWRGVLTFRVRVLAGAALAVWPGQILFTGTVAQDNWVLLPSVALGALAVRALLTGQPAQPIIAGLLYAAGVAIRQEMLVVLLPLFLGATLVHFRPGCGTHVPWRRAAAATLAAAVPLVILAVYRHASTGRFAFSSEAAGSAILSSYIPGSNANAYMEPFGYIASVRPDLLRERKDFYPYAMRLTLQEAMRRPAFHAVRILSWVCNFAVAGEAKSLYWSLGHEALPEALRNRGDALTMLAARPLRFELAAIHGLFLAAFIIAIRRWNWAILVLASAVLLKYGLHAVTAVQGRYFYPATAWELLGIAVAAHEVRAMWMGPERWWLLRAFATGLAFSLGLLLIAPRLDAFVQNRDLDQQRTYHFQLRPLQDLQGQFAALNCVVEQGTLDLMGFPRSAALRTFRPNPAPGDMATAVCELTGSREPRPLMLQVLDPYAPGGLPGRMLQRVELDGVEVYSHDVAQAPWSGWANIALGDVGMGTKRRVVIEVKAIHPDPGVDWGNIAQTTFRLAESSFASHLAMGKPAAQSSTLSGYGTTSAMEAIDGNTDGSFFHGSVTSTNRDTNAWWQVDLGASKAIGSIVIWNRTDCCPSRLSDYWVFLSDTPFSPSDTPATLKSRAGTWSSHQTVVPDPSTTIRTVGANGRYVRVQLTGTDYLSLAEVQVFGQ
jgi:hypothetical protein